MKPIRTAYPGLNDNEKNSFKRIATDVLALDRRIRWVAFEETGHPPCWVWRDPVDGGLSVGAGACGSKLLGPLILIVAEGREEIYGRGSVSHPLRFLILVYNDLIQIAVRRGPDSHVAVGIDPTADACILAEKLAEVVAGQGCRR